MHYNVGNAIMSYYFVDRILTVTITIDDLYNGMTILCESVSFVDN